MKPAKTRAVVGSRPNSFQFPPRLERLCYAAIVAGILAFGLGLVTDHQRAWANFLLEYYYWLGIACAGLFFVAIHHLSGSTWDIPLRRIPEMFIAYLPVAILFFIILLPGLTTLYEWAQVAVHDTILQGKASYLNPPFFVLRTLAVFAVALGLGGWMVRNSLRQDETGDVRFSKLNRKIAAPFLVIFAWAFSFMSIDLLMSLTPHWFSTIFGVYCWSGAYFSALAMITIWTIFLRKRGDLGQYVTVEHYHGLGKLMWAFLVFWAYIAFSQFMLIWYANLPEETPYLVVRMQGGWKPVSIALMLCKFWLPFFFIISQKAKRRERWLLFTAFWFLGAQWIDVYWMVFPTFFTTPVFGWMEVLIYGGFAGSFLLSVGKALSRFPVVAFCDPQLREGMLHHQ